MYEDLHRGKEACQRASFFAPPIFIIKFTFPYHFLINSLYHENRTSKILHLNFRNEKEDEEEREEK